MRTLGNDNVSTPNQCARVMTSHDKATISRQIANVYQSGMTQQQVATQFSVHVQTVRAHLRNAGVVARSRRLNLDTHVIAEARRLHATGIGTRELGRRLNVSHTTIAKALRTYGDTSPPSGTITTTVPLADSDLKGLTSRLGDLDPRVTRLYEV